MVEARVRIARMANKLSDRKAEFYRNEQDLKLELPSANDQKTKVNQLIEERTGEIQRDI